MCEKHDLFGFQNNVNGGMAEYVRLTKEALPYLVPADMPIEKAALIEDVYKRQAYGGANSHMAIRAAEFDLPAVIGVGEKQFSQFLRATALRIDCRNRTVHIL